MNVRTPSPLEEFGALAALVEDRVLFEVIVIAGYSRTLATMLELLGPGPVAATERNEG